MRKHLDVFVSTRDEEQMLLGKDKLDCAESGGLKGSGLAYFKTNTEFYKINGNLIVG